MMLAALLAESCGALARPVRTWGRSRSTVVRMDTPHRPGDVADVSELDKTWSRVRLLPRRRASSCPRCAHRPRLRPYSQAKWASKATTDDGACYVVDDEEAPDPTKSWFFCSDPAEDDKMECTLVPEWMGAAPDGGHAVWLCSTPKVSSES